MSVVTLDVIIVFFGTAISLILIRTENTRRREAIKAERRLDDVADRTAEAARLLASNNVQLTEASNRVADALAAANQLIASKLQAADLNVADTLQAADIKVAGKLRTADHLTKPVSIEEQQNPVPVKVVTEEP